MDGNLAAAVEPYRRMFEMDPGNPMGRLFYVWALALNRRMDAIGAIVEAFPLETKDSVPARLALFLAQALAGNRAAASAVLTPEIEAIATATDLFPRLLAQGYALAGESERALHWLAIAVDRGFINHPFLARHDPFFGSIRTIHASRSSWRPYANGGRASNPERRAEALHSTETSGSPMRDVGALRESVRTRVASRGTERREA